MRLKRIVNREIVNHVDINIMSSQTPKPRREVWWWSRDRKSHGPLCSRKGLRLGKRALRGSENRGFQVHVHLDTVNSEIAMSEISMGYEPLDQVLIGGLLFFHTLLTLSVTNMLVKRTHDCKLVVY